MGFFGQTNSYIWHLRNASDVKGFCFLIQNARLAALRASANIPPSVACLSVLGVVTPTQNLDERAQQARKDAGLPARLRPINNSPTDTQISRLSSDTAAWKRVHQSLQPTQLGSERHKAPSQWHT
jgi:hypothetical protein